MWEKIAKEMQLPWRAAEAMHWQIGEVEMAQRANVPVFHLAAQSSTLPHPTGLGDPRTSDVAPTAPGIPPGHGAYAYSHNHSLPQLPHPGSPVQALVRRNSSDALPGGSIRQRADSARSMANRTLLPPLGEVTNAPSQTKYTLPPVVTSPDVGRI